MVESYANSIEDRLVDGLSFKLEPGASYIHERKSVTFHPQGSNVYSPTQGTKLIKIALTGKDWLDPNTFRVMFDLVNDDPVGTDAKRLRPLSGPWSFFRRVRLMAGGQLIEDIDYYNRVHEMMEILSASDSRNNEDVEGFGYRWDEFDSPNDPNSEVYKVGEFKGIAEAGRQTVLFKPLCGLLNQSKFLPLTYLQSLSLELELVDNPRDPVLNSLGAGVTAGVPAVAPDLAAGTAGTAGNLWLDSGNSVVWHIENVQVKCDVVSLDTGLQNSYDQIVLSSKDIPIHYNTFVSQFQTITGQEEPFVNVSRAATRLKSIFVSLDKDRVGARAGAGRKWWNDFFSPAWANNLANLTHDYNDEVEVQVQIGSKLFPEYPIRSYSEAYYQLRKALGIQSSKMHSFDISPREYRSHRYIVGIDTEKSLGSSFTGINTRSGDLMSVKLKYKQRNPLRLADRIHIILHTDNILQISATGVSVFD